MKIGSLFDGSGTAPLAAAMCGIEPAWASEIEPYPLRVTTARFPHMKHLGDITAINGAEIEPVDIICGGSPCQDLSVAGKQAGLHNGKRSHLFFEMTRIITEMREATNGRYPRYIIWENVPGAFSTNNGADFLAVLRAFAEIADPDVHVPEPAHKGKTDRLAWQYAGSIVGDGYSLAWRTVDAQYWGVPQRRRRIYLIADLGSECAGEILFERKSVSGNPEPGREARKEATPPSGRSTAGSGGVRCLNPWDCQSKRQYEITGVYRTLDAGEGAGGQAHGICYALQGNGIDRSNTAGCNGAGWREDKCYTLNTVDRPAVIHGFPLGYQPENTSLHAEKSATICNGTRPGFTTGVVYDARGNGDGEVACTLTGDHQNRVTDYTALCVGNGQLHQMTMAEQANCLDCMHDQQAVLLEGTPRRKYIVRRLITLECCRLQGFPDWWTEGNERFPVSGSWAENPFLMNWVDPRGAIEGSDSATYKMWGNGMAFPNMLHVMKGIRSRWLTELLDS